MNYSSSQKGIAPIIIVLVFAVILAGVGGVYYLKQHKTEKFPSILDETYFWPTYTSQNYGYQIRHPNLLLNQCNIGGISSNDKLDVVLSQGQPREGTEYCGSYTISVFVDSISQKSIADKLNELITLQTENGGVLGGKREEYVQSETKVGTISAIKLAFKNSFIIYAFNRDSTLYYIQITDNTNGQYQDEITEVISSFKFTELTEISNWKIYRNEKFGFEMKYPIAWQEPNENLLSTRIEYVFSPSNLSITSGFHYNQDLGRPHTYEEESQFAQERTSEIRNISVAGISTKQYIYRDRMNLPPETLVILPGKDNNLFFISMAFPNKIDEEIFDQIISTFKFTQ